MGFGPDDFQRNPCASPGGNAQLLQPFRYRHQTGCYAHAGAADTYRDTGAVAYGDSYTHPAANSGSYPYAHAHHDSGTHPDADAHPAAGTHGRACRHRRAGAHTHACAGLSTASGHAGIDCYAYPRANAYSGAYGYAYPRAGADSYPRSCGHCHSGPTRNAATFRSGAPT